MTVEEHAPLLDFDTANEVGWEVKKQGCRIQGVTVALVMRSDHSCHIGIPSHLVEVNHRQLAGHVSLSNVAPFWGRVAIKEQLHWLGQPGTFCCKILEWEKASAGMPAKQGIQVILNHFRNALRFVSKRDLDAVRRTCAYQGLAVQRVMSRLQTIRISNITSDSQVPMILSSSQPDITHLLLQVVVLARPCFFVICIGVWQHSNFFAEGSWNKYVWRTLEVFLFSWVSWTHIIIFRIPMWIKNAMVAPGFVEVLAWPSLHLGWYRCWNLMEAAEPWLDLACRIYVLFVRSDLL